MECPHCGGPLDVRELKPLEHAAFDDRLHAIIVGDDRHRCSHVQWKILRILRQRYRHFVSAEYLAQWSTLNPLDGGSVDAVQVHVTRLRKKLVGAPFAIANEYGFGYGLFPIDEVTVVEGRRAGYLFTYTREHGPGRMLAKQRR